MIQQAHFLFLIVLKCYAAKAIVFNSLSTTYTLPLPSGTEQGLDYIEGGADTRRINLQNATFSLMLFPTRVGLQSCPTSHENHITQQIQSHFA